jgi:hypothetical protein
MINIRFWQHLAIIAIWLNVGFAPTAAIRKSEWIAMSAFHLEADIAHPRSHVSFVPEAEVVALVAERFLLLLRHILRRWMRMQSDGASEPPAGITGYQFGSAINGQCACR